MEDPQLEDNETVLDLSSYQLHDLTELNLTVPLTSQTPSSLDSIKLGSFSATMNEKAGVSKELNAKHKKMTNPKGLCALSQNSGQMVLVCSGLQKGQVRVEHYAWKRTKFIMAHDSSMACFALSQDGRFLATSSSKGTPVRVFQHSRWVSAARVKRLAKLQQSLLISQQQKQLLRFHLNFEVNGHS